MTIDERLERLTERHEALAQTLEIIAGMQRVNEKGIAELRESMAELRDIVKSHEITWNRLANIVIRHEERLDALDGGDE